MSAYDLSRPDPALAAFIGEPDQCFLCGAGLNGIIVYWSGMGVERPLFLHPQCAQSLGCHLISDSVRAKQMHNRKFKPVLRDAAA